MTASASPLIEVQSRTLDELLSGGEPRSVVLIYGALVRVFTLGQAARLLGSGDVGATEKMLDEMHYSDRWIERLDDVELPRYCGGGKVSVYYLTHRGADALKSVALEVYKHARPGQPKGKLRANIPHELLVAESFLWLKGRYRLREFLPETALKSEIASARVRQAGQRLTVLPDESTGDFRVRLADGGREQTIECEVAVHYKYEEIAGKPHNMLWFTSDARQADLIETIKGARPVMLGSVAAPAGQPDDGPRGTVTPFKKRRRKARRGFAERVLAAVDRLGGCTTQEAICSLMRVNRGNVCRALNDLAKAGTLLRDSAHLRPGADHGRPATLYFRPSSRPQNIHQKVHALIAARAIGLIVPRNPGADDRRRDSEYRLHEYDHTKGLIEFRHRSDAGQPALIFVIDDQQQQPEQTLSRLRTAEIKARTRNAIVGALVAAPVRFARLNAITRESTPKPRILDICALGRRAKEEQHAN